MIPLQSQEALLLMEEAYHSISCLERDCKKPIIFHVTLMIRKILDINFISKFNLLLIFTVDISTTVYSA